jgi:RHS repeat-associated protein
LPGGITNHGDTALTLTNEGKTTTSTNTLLAYGPFGESLVAGTQGTTTVNALNASDDTMGWAASPARKQEGGYTTSFIQMGARVYIPSLGRFLQVDPVDGGTLNGYVYVADPINSSDYNGQWSIRGFITSLVRVVRAVVKAVFTPAKAVARAAAPVRVAAPSGGSPARASASTVSYNSSSRAKPGFSSGVDAFYLQNTVKTFSGPIQTSVGLGASGCVGIVCFGGGRFSDSHSYIEIGIGIGAGVNAGMKYSIGAVNTGLGLGAECILGPIGVELGTGGLAGSLNVVPTKGDCAIKASFTW